MTTTDSAQERLLRQLLAGETPGADNTRIPRVPPGTPVPLTPAQRRIWFFSQLYTTSNEYNVFDLVHVDRTPDEDRLRAALRVLVERHVALRLRLFEVDGEPVQEDCGAYDPEVTWYDLTGYPEDEAGRRATDIANECAREVLRPDKPPLWRFSVIRLPRGRAAFVLGFHHVIADHWSWTQLVEELTGLLAGEASADHEVSEGPDFLDYAAWLHDNHDERRAEDDLAYWAGKLAGPLPVLDLPADRPRSKVSTRAGHSVPVRVSREVLAEAERVAREHGTTLYVVMLAAYHVFLGRLSGQRDLVVGGVFAGRDQPFSERIFGCFVKSVALRTELAERTTFSAAVRAVHRTVLEAQDHQYVPYDAIVARLDVPRDLGVDPVFQAQFSLQAADPLDIDGLETDPGGLSEYGTAKWDMALVLTETVQGLSGLMECSADLFDKATVTRFSAMYTYLLGRLLRDPGAEVADHPLITDGERDHILYGLNPYERPEHSYRSLAEPFEEQVRLRPDATALVGDEGTLTYGELNAEANRLAHHLAARGVGPGTRVALCMHCGFAMVVAIYAVAKAGGTYVPLDPELPDARIRFMLEDTGPSTVLTAGTARARVPAGPWSVISLDDPAPWADMPTTDPDRAVPHQVSHLLYTSGSTGRPKAVASDAAGSVADILWMQRRYPYHPGDTALLKTSYGFDVSLWEICWPLYVGARVAVCRPGEHWDVRYLARMIDEYRVTTAYVIPTQLQVFLDELGEGQCTSLRWMISGGEPVTPRLRDACHARLGAELVNGYGPTEAGRVTDMIVPRDPGNPVVPLGRPSDNFRLHVLDENLDVVPVGVPGEAFIAAEIGLAQGYFNRPALTAERFLPDPYGPPGSRMYRSGDVCRYRDDGVLEHLGRIGNQVKIRGMRIEPSELEAVLAEQEGVDRCVVLVVTEAGEQHLVAFVVPEGGVELDPAEIGEQAARMLPRYMVPTSIQVVDAIVTNVNGKPDREALLAHWPGRAGSPGRPAGDAPSCADEVEEQMAAVFRRILGVDQLAVTDSFFALGGHSLLVFRLIAACTEEFGTELGVAEIFTAPTVRDLAARVRDRRAAVGGSLVPLAPCAGAPVLVFVHAASGSVLPFRELAEHLGEEFSVHALQAPGPDTPGASSVEELALRYLDELEPVRGLSPVFLVGWSMGGSIALEMAREAERRSTPVDATVMLDSWPPPACCTTPAEQERTRRAIGDLDIGAAEGVDLDLLDEDLARVTERNRRALLAHRPEPYAGRVHLLRAAEPLPVTTVLPTPDEDEGAWRSVVEALVRERTPGNHLTLLRGDNALGLARRLRRITSESLVFDEI
ncbi:amino acid adenylation domain-containing protein [Streptomyces olivaceus]|uniref:Amino acid adenylation domain-containing protein n=1 Tax=Streptomyces olivaceus TaxID=47716 RepID=A0ABS7WED0_STROV|nr:non-ribosomal peptide synthetase [Streptomyces olivaceus]MBZ6093491.1 amino acid adenylation domain-containing protein [Streptomyces olivaceus]MBZ6100424.1 amino acid adenylation domain-containing protein [Streptomyces olivaceus]MBZ6121588.1 amino acid adenylation domain-containing protein [Streptomyces olivaceus]MBZ6156324.1 amino acid adenylation domain-containing protein [Streptomyces olivaceus]MBZ6302850.1 amino acid adenylation domain-containing protein [Streptomyces olivaceus]